MDTQQNNISHNTQTIELSAAEIGHLFTTYISSSMTRCVLSYFNVTTQDADIKSVTETCLNQTNDLMNRIKSIYASVQHPIPAGLTDQDVNLGVKKLFSDTFVLYYLRFNTQFSLINYGAALIESARGDVRTFFSDCLNITRDLYNKIQDLLLSKGLFIRPPTIPIPREIGYVHKQSILKGFIGDKRPVNAVEIANIYAAIETNLLGRVLCLAFSQVIKDERMKHLCIKGEKTSTELLEGFGRLLENDYLNVPTSWNISISDSTESPFSEKLIAYHMSTLSAFGLGRYGLSVSQCLRKDVIMHFGKAASATSQYAMDWLDVILDMNWLERIPEAVDRAELVNA